MKTKIILINCHAPDFIGNKEYVMPPSLLQLAGVLLRYDTDVEIIDLNVTNLPDKFDANFVGIGCLFSGQFPEVVSIAKKVKEYNKYIKVIVGGIHPTLFPTEIIKNIEAIDYVIIGEGEYQLSLLVNGYSVNDGIAFRKDSKPIIYPKTKYINNLDTLPLPAYHLVNPKNYEQDLSHWHNPRGLKFNFTVPIISSRSCPMECNFCSMKLVMGPTIRFKSPLRVVDEIELLYHQWGQNRFSFMDDNLTLNKNHITGICNEIIRRNLNIQWETPNGLMLKSLTVDIIDLMVKSGWVRGMIAIESGNAYIRNKIMKKNLDTTTIYDTIHFIKKHYPFVYLRGLFIMGMPEETNATLQDTYTMIQALPLDAFSIANLMPFPGTKVFEQAVRDNLIINLSLTDMWKEVRMDYNDNNKFYIKPYHMTEEQLMDWRTKFNQLEGSANG